jgi:hypothetical protein
MRDRYTRVPGADTTHDGMPSWVAVARAWSRILGTPMSARHCWVRGCKAPRPTRAHIIPRSRGGPNCAANLVLLCWAHHIEREGDPLWTMGAATGGRWRNIARALDT